MVPQDKYFIIFRADSLNMSLVSQVVPSQEDITCFQSFNHDTYVVAGEVIFIYRRIHIIGTLNFHQQPILGLCKIGNHLVSFDDHTMYIIDITSQSLLHALPLIQSSPVSHVMHPATYINKVLVIYANCHIELWNVIRQKLIYTFQSHLAYAANLQDKGVITAMEQSPALDVVALGYSSGLILLMNLKTDTVLFHFQQELEVTALTFRTDAVADKFPYLASSNIEGVICLWNLGDGTEESPRRLQETMEEAHQGYVSKLVFLHGEPVMVSAAEDNSLKVCDICVDFLAVQTDGVT